MLVLLYYSVGLGQNSPVRDLGTRAPKILMGGKLQFFTPKGRKHKRAPKILMGGKLHFFTLKGRKHHNRACLSTSKKEGFLNLFYFFPITHIVHISLFWL